MDKVQSHAAITIDPGSCYLKAGYSGKMVPSIIMPNAVGYTKKIKGEVEKMEMASIKNDVLNSSELMHSKDRSETMDEAIKRTRADMIKSYDLAQLSRFSEKKHIVRPIFRGELADEGAFRDIMKEVIQRLGGSSDVPVFLSIPVVSDIKTVYRMTEILIEEELALNVGLMYSAPLSLIAAGKTTGLAVEAGYSMCSVSPVYNGTVVKKRMAWNSITSGMGLEALVYEYARKDLGSYMETLGSKTELSKVFGSDQIESFEAFIYQEWTRDLVSQLTYQSRELHQPAKVSLEVSTLPDGTMIEGDNPTYITLPPTDEFITPNYSLSLYPQYYGNPVKTTGPLSLGSIFNFIPLLKKVLCPMTETSIRTLIGNQTGCVVPSGGMMEAVTPLSSAQATLRATIESLFPSIRSRMSSPVRPFCSLSNAPCIGGCILSSLSSSNIMLISRRELAEYGERVIYEKLD